MDDDPHHAPKPPSAPRLPVGIGTPLGYGITPLDLIRLAVAADVAGLDGVSLGELASTEVFSLAGGIAVLTSRIRIETAIVPVVVIWVHYLGLPFSGRIGLLGLTTAAWFFCNCSVLARCLAPAPAPAPSRAAEPVVNDPARDNLRNAEIGLTLVAQRSA